MHVHAADHEAAANSLQVGGERLIARAGGRPRRRPFGEWVCGCRDRSEAVPARYPNQRRAQPSQVLAHLCHRIADPRPRLDLRTKELWTDLAAELGLALGKQRARRIGRERSGLALDEVIFLLDAEGETWLARAHGNDLPWSRDPAKPEPVEHTGNDRSPAGSCAIQTRDIRGWRCGRSAVSYAGNPTDRLSSCASPSTAETCARTTKSAPCAPLSTSARSSWSA